MRRFIYLIIIIILFLGASLVALPFFVSDESIKNTITSTIQEKTGRTLTIKGKTTLSAIPSLAIELGDVHLSNPKGMTEGQTISAQHMKVKLPLLPLLTGELQLDQFILNKPVITFLKDNKGQVNWAFGDKVNEDEKESSEGQGGELGPLTDIKLGKIKIVDGQLSYVDQMSGASQKITDINVDVNMRSLASPLGIDGSLVWRAEKITLAVNMESPKKFLGGENSPLKLEVKSKNLTTSLKGSATLKNGPIFNGDFAASSPALKSLIAWTGSPAPTIGGLGPFFIRSKLAYSNNQLALNNTDIKLDKMDASGNAKLILGGARPKISGALNFNVIDLNPYMSGAGGKSGKSAKRSSAGWSRDRIDLSGLRAADADLSLKANKLIARDINIENVILTVKLDNGVLRAGLPQFTLYGGKGKGAVTLNGRGGTPALASQMQLSGMNARNFLKAVTGFGKIEGAAAFDYNVSSSGNSQYGLMKAMQGRGKFNFSNGAIRGINIAQMMRNLGTNVLNGWSASEAQKTDFSSFSGSYTISQGQLKNTDLKLLGPLVRLTGAGTVNLPGRSLNYKVNPKLVASLKGQGGAANLAGLDVPIIIKGPWAKPQIYPDIAGILQNPEAAYRNLKNLGKSIDPKKGVDTLNKLLNGGGQNGQQGGGQQDPIKGIEKQLKGLF